MSLTHFSLIAALAGGVATTAWGEVTQYPLTSQNCGTELRFDAAPDTTITIGQATTEILYLLGLGQKVVGTSVWFNPVLPEFAALNGTIERLADNDPSFESVVSKRPDLVTVEYEWHVGPEGMVGTRDMFEDLGIATYVMPTDCDNKDNTIGLDGTRSAKFSTESIYKTITELAMIYDIQDHGADVVNDLRAREAEAIAKAHALDLPKGTSAAFWFSSADLGTDPFVAGRHGVPAYMMDKLGIDNVVTSDEEWPAIGWETIAKADPTYLILGKMDRRRFPADDVDKKREFLLNDPVTREMSAVRNGRIIVMDADAMGPTVRTIFGLETLAEAIAGFEPPR